MQPASAARNPGSCIHVDVRCSQAGGLGGSTGGGGGEEEDALQVKGSYGTKVGAAAVDLLGRCLVGRCCECCCSSLPAPQLAIRAPQPRTHLLRSYHPAHPMQLEAVVRRLLWLTRRDATARVLVFSTWKDVLELIRWARNVMIKNRWF